jgi:glycosyltransferase involved in cell wall biosynthesis
MQTRYLEDYIDADGNYHKTLNVDELKALDVQACIFSRNISYRCDPAPVFARLKAAGIKIVIDIDDYWKLPKWHIMSHAYAKQNMSRMIEDQIIMSDYVICTHPQLRAEIAKVRLVRNVFVAPNGIDASEEQFTHNHLSHDFESVYWQGSPTHYHDIKLLQGAFSGLVDYKFTIGGHFEGDPEWAKMVELFTRDNMEYEPAVDVGSYARGYWNKGICVVPLQDNKFNRMKSELKVIEAGWFGKPVIGSKMHPYTRIIKHMENGYLATNTQDFAKYIKAYLGSQQLQIDMGMALHDTVMHRYTIEKTNESRIELLNKIRNGR